MSSVMVNPTEYASRRPGVASQLRNSWVPPPESARIRTRRRRRRGSCARASVVASMCSLAVLDPAFPGPQQDGQRLARALRRRDQRTRSAGWNPNVFFHVGVAWSFSEHEVTTVASISTVTRPPSAPGAASPASAQARSRAAARAERIAFKARGASAARRADQPGDHRVGGHRPEQLPARRAAPRYRPGSRRPARASPPGQR